MIEPLLRERTAPDLTLAERAGEGRPTAALPGTRWDGGRRIVARLVAATVLIAAAGVAMGEQLPPPTGFRSLNLGDPVESVKSNLEADTNFAYRGDPDVSLLPQDRQTLIETEGRRFIRRAYFQFYSERLYSITIDLDEGELDYYTMYTALTQKYGEPTTLSPEEAVWLSDAVRFSLERPLTVKYVDLPVFNERIRRRERAESMDQFARDRFVDQF